MSGYDGIPMNQRDLLFVDIETNGLDPSQHEILELAAVRLNASLQRRIGYVDRRCKMVHPERSEAKALEVNRYSDREWLGAPPARVALVEFANLLGTGDAMLIGQNPSFDWSFIREGLRREEIAIPNTKYLIDIASIAWPLVVRGHIDRINLETLCRKYGIPNEGAHRAMPDVKRSIYLYGKLLGLKPSDDAMRWQTVAA